MSMPIPDSIVAGSDLVILHKAQVAIGKAFNADGTDGPAGFGMLLNLIGSRGGSGGEEIVEQTWSVDDVDVLMLINQLAGGSLERLNIEMHAAGQCPGDHDHNQ